MDEEVYLDSVEQKESLSVWGLKVSLMNLHW